MRSRRFLLKEREASRNAKRQGTRSVPVHSVMHRRKELRSRGFLPSNAQRCRLLFASLLDNVST